MCKKSRIIPGLLGCLTICLGLTVTVVISCSSDSPTESNDGIGGIDTIAVTTDVAQTTSLSWIEVTGLPSDNDNLFGIVLPGSGASTTNGNSTTFASAASDTAYTLILQTDSGSFMVAPLNPADPINGGSVLIIITDDSSVISEPIEFTVDPLPSAPGELSETVDLLQQVFDYQLRSMGLTRDSLDYSVPSSIPTHHLPHIFVYDALGSPDNPNSLQAFVDGTAPLMNSTAADVDLVDRLLALTGYREYLQDYVAALDTVDTAGFTPISPNRSGLTFAQRSLSPGACIAGPDLGISSCADLANAMRYQTTLAVAARSAAEKVKADIAANTLKLVALIPGSQVPTTILGSLMFIEAKVAEGQANLFPSEFVESATTFNPSKTEFNEDFTVPGNWTEFKVSAVSKGWKLDKLILETILEALNAKGAANQAGNLPPSLAQSATEFNETVEGAVKSVKAAQTFNELAGGDAFVEICPNTWSDIECAGNDYSVVTVSSGNLDVDETAQTYKPTEIGPAVMRIETNASFGEDKTGRAVAINTNQIEVSIDPFQAEADTSEERYFSASVENAENTNVTWSLEGGGSFFPDQHLVTVFTPESPWDPPLTLRARSLANTGLREGKVESDPREDEAEIRHKGEGIAIVTPGSWCIRPGEDQDFTVTYTGSEIESVEWEIDPPETGSILGSGETITYQAPNDPVGNVTLSATVNDSITGYAYVDVSSCVCNWMFAGLGSSGTFNGSGEWATASLQGGLVVKLRPDSSNDSFNPPFVSLISYDANGVGTFDAASLLFVVSDTLDWGMTDPDVLPPIVEITAYEANDYVQGTASGTLSRKIGFNAEGSIYEYITFSMSFRAEFFNLQRPQCVDD